MKSTETTIRTTFLELIQQLTALTKDDGLVIAAVKDIFSTYKITATRSMAPVKLVVTAPPTSAKSNRRRIFRA